MHQIHLTTEVTEDNLRQYVLREIRLEDPAHQKARQRLTADSPWYALQAALDMAAADGTALHVTEQAIAWLKDRNPDRPETSLEKIERLELELMQQKDLTARGPLDNCCMAQAPKMLVSAAAYAALPGTLPKGTDPEWLAAFIQTTIRKLRARLNEPAY